MAIGTVGPEKKAPKKRGRKPKVKADTDLDIYRKETTDPHTGKVYEFIQTAAVMIMGYQFNEQGMPPVPTPATFDIGLVRYLKYIDLLAGKHGGKLHSRQVIALAVATWQEIQDAKRGISAY